MNSNQLQQIQQRRNKSNMENRNYGCHVCPKSYLSYAALYTHIKAKHKEVQQGEEKIVIRNEVDQGRNQSINLNQQRVQEADLKQTYMRYNLNIQKFNRQSKYPKIMKNKNQINQKTSFIYFQQSNDNNIQLKTISMKARIKHLIINISIFFQQKQNQYIQLVESGNISPQESFPLSLFEAEPQTIIHSLYVKLSQYHFTQNKDDISCNEIFAEFLIEISKHLTVKAYKELCFFIMMIKKVANSFGEEQYLNYLKENESDEKVLKQHLEYFQKQVTMKQEICELAIGEILPDLANLLFLNINSYYQTYLSNQQFLDFSIIGFNPYVNDENAKQRNERKKSNLIQFIQFFCNCLYEKKYTNSFLELKQSEGNDSPFSQDEQVNLFQEK